MIATATCTVFLLVGNPNEGLAQVSRVPDVPSAPVPIDPLDLFTKRALASRFLAEMGPDTPIDTKVGRLIDRLVLRDHDLVQAAVTALTMLGQPAVPAIIRRLDDRRAMPMQAIAFENRSANAFEAVRQYGTNTVVDCLADVLNDITGESFGSVHLTWIGEPDRAESDARREAIVAGWREYLAQKQAMPRVPGKSLPLAEPPASSAPREAR